MTDEVIRRICILKLPFPKLEPSPASIQHDRQLHFILDLKQRDKSYETKIRAAHTNSEGKDLICYKILQKQVMEYSQLCNKASVNIGTTYAVTEINVPNFVKSNWLA